MKTKRLLGIAAGCTVTIGAATLLVRACGPDFVPDVFIPSAGPADQAGYAKGQLGVLQAGYYIAPKAVAFRYLNGGTLNAQEQGQLAKINDERINFDHLSGEELKKAEAAQQAAAVDTGPARWSTAALPFGQPGTPGQRRDLKITQGNVTQEVQLLNCPDPAFDTAVATLRDRERTWGKENPAFRDWVRGQIAVFTNCVTRGEVPADAPSSAPPLLRQDRAYQKAAALFYAGDYERSAAAFTAIADNTASPWSRWGDYLAARSLVRQASLSTKVTDPYSGPASFDHTLLAQAAAALNAAQKGASNPAVHHAIQAELDFVNARLEPEAQLQRLAAFVAGPQHDPDFGQHLVDLRFLLDAGKTTNAPLLQWMQATGTTFGVNTSTPVLPPKISEDATAARTKQATPWLVAALMGAGRPDPTLLKAAADIPEISPAYLTAQFHRARLLLAAGQVAAARELTTHVLTVTRGDKNLEATNAFLGLHLQTSETLDAFLADAPREMISSGSQASVLAACADQKTPSSACNAPVSQVQFDADSAAIFNQRLPLSLWVEASHSSALPPHLQARVAYAAWLRALILNQADVARSLIPQLPEPVRKILSKSPDPNGFAASLILLHGYGFRPYLNQGVQRSASYAVFDDVRDNWWCAGSTNALEPYSQTQPAPAPAPPFLTPRQLAEAKQQVAVLDANSNGVVWLGQRTLDYVNAHPDQPVAAESLALVVRATHYGCYVDDAGTKAATQVSKEAFNLLHTRYPKSDWTARTPYFY